MTLTTSAQTKRAPKASTSLSVAKTQAQSLNNLLEQLFKDKPDNHYILIWLKLLNGRKLSKFFHSISEAQDFALSQKDLADVYFGVATSSIKKKYYERFKIEEVEGLACLYVDIDYGVHDSDKVYPPTQQDAIELLKAMSVEATIINDSGHGLHAYWLFDEFQVFENDEQRTRIALLNHAWQSKLRELANKHGWTLDATQDLARVLRVPATRNHKDPNDVKTVTRLNSNDKRFSVETLESYVQSETTRSTTQKTKTNGKASTDLIKITTVDPNDLVVSDNPLLSVNRLTGLFESDPRIKQVFEYKLKSQKDKSPSGWDMTLANYGIHAGWSNQDICDLMILSRIENKVDLKLNDARYYALTITEARNGAANLEKETKRQESIEAPISKSKEVNLRDVSTALGIDIKEIRKTDYVDEPTYAIHLIDNTTIELKSINELRSMRIFDNRIAARINKSINYITPRNWRTLFNKMLASLTIVPPPKDASDESVIREMLVSYLVSRYKPEDDEQEQKKNVHARHPAHYNGNAVFFLGHFSKHLKEVHNQDPTRPKLAAIFHRLGCVQTTISYRHDEKAYPINADGWIVPNDILEVYRTISSYNKAEDAIRDAEDAKRIAKYRHEKEEYRVKHGLAIAPTYRNIDSSREGS